MTHSQSQEPTIHVKEQYSTFSPEVQNSFYGKQIKINIDFLEGATLPDFTLTDINGATIKLSDFKGKYVLLDFWGSWCGPCRQSNKKVVELYQTYKNKGLDIIGLAYDDNKDSWQEAIEQDGLIWQQTNLLDNPDVNEMFGVSSFPTYFLVSPEQKILVNSRESNSGIDRISNVLDETFH